MDSTTFIADVSVAILLALTVAAGASENHETTYLPDATASKAASVTQGGEAAANFTVLTRAVAIKETGPQETIEHFGEVYAFSPSVLIVHRDEPTEISFWNLQPDDEHDFMLADPQFNVLMRVMLSPLKKTTYVFRFHRDGVFPFYCTMHQPAMSGQILVLPPVTP